MIAWVSGFNAFQTNPRWRNSVRDPFPPSPAIGVVLLTPACRPQQVRNGEIGTKVEQVRELNPETAGNARRTVRFRSAAALPASMPPIIRLISTGATEEAPLTAVARTCFRI